MGFFSNLFRGRDAPSQQHPRAGSGYGFFMGSTASGKRVNARSAMQMTAVYSCVRILSEAVAGLPLQFYRYNDNGGKEKAVDHLLYFLLHDEPNPEMTSFVFRETLMTHLLLWGNAYSQIIRNGKGEIVALYPLMPDRMTVDRDEHGRLYYQYLVYDGDDVDGRTGTGSESKWKNRASCIRRMCCIFRGLDLTGWSDIHLLPWRRMRSGLPLLRRSMEASFMPTVPLRQECWSIRGL